MTTTTGRRADVREATPGATATRRMLACGAGAGPLFIAVAGVQVLTREGFDLTRHPLSLLSLGEYGAVQIANFVVSGVLYVVAAAGLRRTMGAARGSRWAPRLIGVFGVSLVAAGAFAADPVDGFPTPDSVAPADPTWPAIAHGTAPALGFLALIAACVVLAAHFRQRGDRVRAIGSLVVALALLVPDVLMGTPGFTVALAAAAAVGWGWTSYVAHHMGRRPGH